NPHTSLGTGSQAIFTSWSDGGAFTHFLTATGTPTTYTANFTLQYQLTTSVSPAGSATITPASGAYYEAGSTVLLSVTPSGSLPFRSWTGPVLSAGPLTGTVVMSGPIRVTANFGAATAPS